MIEALRQPISAKVTVAAVVAVEAMLVGGVELRAPWSGLAIAVGASGLVAVGLRGMFVAVAVTAALLIGRHVLLRGGDLDSNGPSVKPEAAATLAA
jgi:hypothetical protein